MKNGVNGRLLKRSKKSRCKGVGLESICSDPTGMWSYTLVRHVGEAPHANATLMGARALDDCRCIHKKKQTLDLGAKVLRR